MSVVEARTDEAVPDALRAAVLALNPEQREELLLDLLVSLGDGPQRDEGYDESWSDELDRRLRSIEDGTAKLVPWEEVKARLGKRPVR